jgi:hypothetical protein
MFLNDASPTWKLKGDVAKRHLSQESFLLLICGFDF